jgi:Cd2+/Zn2+-exporting ATPase
MGCSCCSTDCEEETDCGCGTEKITGSGVLARFAIRLLALRFVIASLLFASGLFFQVLRGPSIPGQVLLIFSWCVAGYRVVFNALRNISRGKIFDENFLMTVATVGAFGIGQWSEGAAVMLFYNLGEMVQESAVSRSRRSISALMDVRPDFARLKEGNAEVNPATVPTGSLILVQPGEKVPLDGIITEGSSSFNTSGLTGESLPREAFTGEPALAGFVNGGGLLVIRTTAVFADSAASRMLQLIEDAQSRKAKAEKLITSFARIYTPIVTIGAVLLALLPPLVVSLATGSSFFIWESFRPWVSRALVFLVISCPCAFVISVPLGFFGGIGGAAKSGVLVKGADYLDVLAKARAVVFDKTGTLTRGVFRVQSIEAAVGYTERYVAEIGAVAEWHSNHPAALAISSHAYASGISADISAVEGYAEMAGFGVFMKYGEIDLRAGSRRFLEESRITGLPLHSEANGTAVEIAYGGKFAGRIILNDEVNEDTALAVYQLKNLGIQDVVMLSGDTSSTAKEIAGKAGITEVHSGVLPHQKVAIFEEISARVKAKSPGATVLFVGDGINDAPVLARADAGIAMGGIGSDAAVEAADIVLMNDSPLLVATAIRIARWTRKIVYQNILLSFIIKIGFLVLGAFGFATLWEAVFADVGVALLATLNSLRARNLPPEKNVK